MEKVRFEFIVTFQGSTSQEQRKELAEGFARDMLERAFDYGATVAIASAKVEDKQ